MRSGAKQKRCRILVRRKGSIKTFSSSSCFLLSFVDYILVSECVSLLSHPATLSEWWLAPPGGGTGEQRLLCQEVDRMRDPLQTAQCLTAHTQTCSLASLLLLYVPKMWAHLLVLILSSSEHTSLHFGHQLVHVAPDN